MHRCHTAVFSAFVLIAFGFGHGSASLADSIGHPLSPGGPGAVMDCGGEGGDWFRPLYVRSDVSGGGQTTAGADVLGLDHDGVGQLLIGRADLGGFVTCTGSLLWTGRHVLTAAHCLVSDAGEPAATSASITWQTPGGSVSADAITAFFPSSGGSLLFSGSVLDGWDIAVLELAETVADVPRYDMLRGDASELNQTVLKFGYGRSGIGSQGSTLTAGTKRTGLNEWESLGLGALGVGGITNSDTQLTYDFDSGLPANDAFDVFFDFPSDLGAGDEEVGAAPGDSGGPSFVRVDGRWVLAGITSYGVRLSGGGGQSDVDGVLNSSWGEFAADARVAHPGILDFILDVVPPFGDADGDGDVDVNDLSIMADRWNQTVSGGASDGDFTRDGFVDVNDLSALADLWNVVTAGATASSPPATVPEPASAAALALGAGIILRRRRGPATSVRGSGRRRGRS